MSGFLTDENFPIEAVEMLRRDGVDIISATESFKGADDEILLRESIKLKRILITFDKDFGEFVFYSKKHIPYGAILLRIKPKSALEIYKVVSNLLRGEFPLAGHFSVVTEKKIRMIPLDK